MVQQFTAIIERVGDGFTSQCPQLDIASQGSTVEEARTNLIEALELFFEVADPAEIQDRLRSEVFVTNLEVAVGQVASSIRSTGLQNPGAIRLHRGMTKGKSYCDAKAQSRFNDNCSRTKPSGD